MKRAEPSPSLRALTILSIEGITALRRVWGSPDRLASGKRQNAESILIRLIRLIKTN